MGQGSAVPWKDIKVEVGVDRLSSSSCDFHLPSTIYHLPSTIYHLPSAIFTNTVITT
jgi:hypothetical protein